MYMLVWIMNCTRCTVHTSKYKNVKSFYVIQSEVVGVSKAFCGSCSFILTEFAQIIIKNFSSYRTISNCSLHYNA